MAVEKRALDDLDALFRAVPDKAAVSSSSTPRPSKKLRNASNSRRPLSTPALSQERSIGVKKQQERVSDEINNSRPGGAGIAGDNKHNLQRCSQADLVCCQCFNTMS